MCGICGFIQMNGQDASSMNTSLEKMADSISHRGPDSAGVWLSGDSQVGLGHRRLAILDLSPAGNQPMVSADGRYAIAYNGEVYNHMAMRRELEIEGYSFRGSSDTETLLAAIAEWGLSETVNRCIGMFAFAVWDTVENKLHLVRDRVGIKPLYYGQIATGFIFGSELKALTAHPDFCNAIDRNGLSLFFRYSYIPSPHTIFSDVYKMKPGTILTVDKDGATSVESYWSAVEVWSQGNVSPFEGTELEATDALEELLYDAVKMRMLSDVPIGAFLSGGIDSSTVVSLMQKASVSPVKTFSIGFHEKGFNEAPMAARIAKHLGTDHTEFYVTPKDMLEVVPHLPELWDEPFGDSSQVPTYLLSQLTRNEVTVSLSGDGGDELFHGYSHYFSILSAWQKVQSIPSPLRVAASKFGATVLSRLLRQRPPYSSLLLKRLQLLGVKNYQAFYRNAVSQDIHPELLVLHSQEAVSGFSEDYSSLALDNHQLMSLLDTLTYLPEDILTKVDRASMGVSLEARVPLLDHRVVEFAARLPSSMNIGHGKGKYLLHQVLARHVPKELYERPKMGFGVPLGAWLRNDLRDWAESLLNPERIKSQGYLHSERVRQLWRQFLGGDDSKSAQLWNILMFQSWLKVYGQ